MASRLTTASLPKRRVTLLPHPRPLSRRERGEKSNTRSYVARRTSHFLEVPHRTPRSWRTRAAEIGCHALAITDRNSLAGVVRAHQAAKSAGVKLLVGAEITPLDGAPVVLLAMNIHGYRICRNSSRADDAMR